MSSPTATSAELPTTAEALEEVLAHAHQAFPGWSRTTPEERAAALGAVADALDAAADELVPLAIAETHLSEGRLRGELTRTTFQLRLFAEVVTARGYLDARIDHADPAWPMGARPDTRRIGIPIGPVLVFAASNFPFAFSVAGGDTASALAAGCPVVLKAHPGHPGLSRRTGEIVAGALAGAGAPAGTFAVVAGVEAGITALNDARIKAGAFTGSIAGGRALFDIAQRRADPIPFYGELGSVNPVFVTRAAAARRPEEIVAGFVGSFTVGSGQFCTKPGVFLVPADSGLPELLEQAAYPAPQPMLNDRIASGYVQHLQTVAGHAGVTALHGDASAPGEPPAPTLLRTTAAELLADPAGLVTEVFGPASLVATYDSEADLLAVAEAIQGQLTATVVGEDDDTIAPDLVWALSQRAGRILWNQWPTGLSVTYAQQHGGPYPATTASATTSVGTAAISRFIRPVAYQNLPAHLLPAELGDENRPGPALVDGRPVLG